MIFSPYRSEHDTGYDSLWSDSEEEEYPVNDYSDSEEEELTPPRSSSESGGVHEEVEEDEERDEDVNERQHKRRSLLQEFSSPRQRHDDTTPRHQGETKSSPARASPASKAATRRRSLQPGLFTQEQLNADLEQLGELVDQWSLDYYSKYNEENKQEQEFIKRQQDRLAGQQQKDREDARNSVKAMNDRRRSKIQFMIQQREKLELLIEQEEQEAERQRQEEKRRREQEEEERRRKEEEEQKEREKQEALRREKEAEERKAKEEAERKVKEEQEAAERKRQEEEEEEEKKRQAEEKERNEQQKAEEQKQPSQFTNWSSVEEEYKHYKQIIEDIKLQILKPVSEDKQMKTYCFQAKRKIKPKLGQLTTAKSHVAKVLGELKELFAQIKQEGGELPYKWCLNFFAKSVVQQAETEATVSIHTATPLGVISAQLMADNPELVELLKARFVKKCPYIIGYSCTTDTEEGRARMGWKKVDGRYEDETLYADRIGGITLVWSVITSSRFGKNSAHQHPYPVKHAWVFLARQANKPATQLTNAAFRCVSAWWEASAHRFIDHFGQQGEKLLKLIANDWPNSVADKKYPAAARLRLLGEDWQRTGVVCRGLPPLE